jgi:hypothetical protein
MSKKHGKKDLRKQQRLNKLIRQSLEDVTPIKSRVKLIKINTSTK